MMNRRSIFIACLMLVAVSNLGACAWFGGNKSENSPAKLREALEVPPDLARPAGDDLSSIPADGTANLSKYGKARTDDAAAVTTTNSGGVATADKRVRLDRDGALRWLVVQDNPEHAWVAVREYFLHSDQKLSLEDPKAGILETEWKERSANIGSGFFGGLMNKIHSTGLRDKIRVRVERGRVPGTSEIYVAHQGLEEVVVSGGGVDPTQTTWKAAPSNPEMEAEVLAKLMTYLGADPAQADKQLAASSSASITLKKDQVTLPQDDLDTAWRRVGLALDRAGVITEDRDRSAEIYYVRYVSAQASKRRGGMSWLLSDNAGSEKPLSTDRFQVRLKALATGVGVSISDVKGEPDSTGYGQELLNLLYQQLR